MHGWSNVIVPTLIKLLQETLPKGNSMDKSLNNANDMLSTFGLDYDDTHSYSNDHVLLKKDLVVNHINTTTWQEITDGVKQRTNDGFL